MCSIHTLHSIKEALKSLTFFPPSYKINMMNFDTPHAYDLCFAWNWEYDADFTQFLASASERNGLSLLQVTPANLEATVQALTTGEIYFRSFFDRASDGDAGFMPLVEWAQAHDIPCINCFIQARQAINKASCHLDFITAGLYTPYTIILPTFQEQPELSTIDLSPLGPLFAIKPSHGGGGDGVILEATAWEQVISARQQFPDDHYLLQAHITPVLLDGREAWFRVIGCVGQAYPCWWDTRTHIYSPLTAEEESRYGLQSLREIPQTIGRMYGLELFSTEIAYTAEGLFVVVDYINDPIDLRLQSKALDGIPDAIVGELAEKLIGYVKEKIAA
jgi:hypothetical protein